MESLIIMLFVSGISAIAQYMAQGARQDELLWRQQDFNSAEAEKAREFMSEPERYNRLVGLGVNPDLALASIMGNSQGSSFAATSPSSIMPADMSSLSNLFGGFADKFLTEQLNKAQIDNLNANTRGVDITNGFLPITLQAQIDHLDAMTSELVKQGFLDDAQADYFRQQAFWIGPKSMAEIQEMNAHVTEMFAAADKFWAEVDTQEALASLYNAEEKLTWQQVKAQSLQNRILSVDAENAEAFGRENASNEALSTFAKSQQDFYDVNMRGYMSGLPFSGDVLQDLFFMRSTPEGKEFSEKFIKASLQGSRELYDMQIENQMDHYWDNFWLSLGANDVVHGASSLGGAAMIGRGRGAGKGLGMQTTPKAVPVDPKPAKFVPQVRVDKNGQKWKSYQYNGEVKWFKVYDNE